MSDHQGPLLGNGFMFHGVKQAYEYGDVRAEVKLNDGRTLTVFVNPDGTVRILTNDNIGQTLIPNEGYFIKVEHYGHPYED